MSTVPDTTRLGIACMLGGMLLISVNDMLIKSLSGGYPLHQIVFFRSGFGVILTLGILKFEGGWKLMNTGQPLLHGLRALLVVVANSAIYAAVVAMPLATANAIYFIAPLLVMMLSIPVLGETVGVRRLAAAGVGFGGVLIMILPELAAGAGGYGLVVLLPLVAAAGYAGMSVLTRKLGATSRASALAIHLHAAFLIVSLVMFLLAGDGRYVDAQTGVSAEFLLRAWVWPDAQDWPALMGLGAMSAVVGYLMTQAYRMAQASVVAPYEYVLLIFALFWGWAVFGEWPERTVFIGAGIVIASGLYAFVREGQVARADRRKVQ